MRRSNSLEKAIQKAKTENDRRMAADYDGILGELPEWMPDPLRQEFHSVRGRLLDKFREWQVRTWMAAMDDFLTESAAATQTGKPYRGGFVSIPPEVTRDIGALRYIRDIESLGRENGIEAYLGKGAVKVYRGTAINTHATKIGRLGGRTRTGDGTRRARAPTRVLIKIGTFIEKQMRKNGLNSFSEFKRRVRESLDSEYRDFRSGKTVDYPFKNTAGEVIRCPSSTLSDYFTKYKPADFVDD